MSSSVQSNTLRAMAGAGDSAGAQAVKSQLASAAVALRTNRPDAAELLLQQYLGSFPEDVQALSMLAEALVRLDRGREAEAILAQAIELAPDNPAVGHHYASVLVLQSNFGQATAQLDRLIAREPYNHAYRNLKATACAGAGAWDEALAEYEAVLKSAPEQPAAWLAYAHALRMAGRGDECIVVYRQILERFPFQGAAWWCLASLPAFRFEPAEIDRLRTDLAAPNLRFEARAQMHFASGKALDDTGHFSESLAEYRKANVLIRSVIDYDADRMAAHMSNSKSLFTREFVQARRGFGCEAATPVFIVGMPESGSTMVERILAKHSAIAPVEEGRVLIYLAARLCRIRAHETKAPATYPELLAELDAGQAQALGEEYMRRMRANGTPGGVLFIDRQTANFAHFALIQLILPNAKIVDVRRHPLDCCVSGYKQYFAIGRNFSYGLTDIGRHYRDYVELMAHFDDVLPGRVHRVFWERLVENPEMEIRRLFEYLDLAFEEQCAHMIDRDHAVWSGAVGAGRDHEEWLEPLRTALRPVLDAYPDIPAFCGGRHEEAHNTDWRRDRDLWSELYPDRQPQIV